MSHAIDGGNGDGEVYRNGNHHVHAIGRRIRSRNRRSRDYGGVSDTRVPKPLKDKERAPLPCTDFDAAYFHSYAHLGIHEEMIKDRVRTETYRNAIFQHQHLIEGKVVVDVGCGTGILSIFCAQAGARQVYAVDASDIAVQAKEVVKANNLSDTITVLHGRIEPCGVDTVKFPVVHLKRLKAKCKRLRSLKKVIIHGYALNNSSHQILRRPRGYIVLASGTRIIFWERWVREGLIVTPASQRQSTDVEINEEVDVIVSEWMGYMLLYESMLGSVITARDRWLKPGGLILPSYATLYMAPVSHPCRYSGSVDFWRNVYGIDMSVMMPLAKQCAFEEPSVELISGENVLTWPHVVKHVDCSNVTIHELECVSTKFKFTSMMRAPFHGFAFWFDVEFGAPASVETPDGRVTDSSQRKKRSNSRDTLLLSTAPEEAPTHWQQTLVYLYDPIEVEQDQLIEGSVTLSQSKENPRFMNIHLEYASNGRLFVKESVMR